MKSINAIKSWAKGVWFAVLGKSDFSIIKKSKTDIKKQNHASQLYGNGKQGA